MNEAFELKGKWFLPSNPNNVAYGIAKFDPDNGTFLELLGSFNGNFFEQINPNQDIIWGITNDSKCII